MPRLARGSLGRQQRGHWNTTVANAWGVLAMEKFAAQPSRRSRWRAPPREAREAGASRLDWSKTPQGEELVFAWPQGPRHA